MRDGGISPAKYCSGPTSGCGIDKGADKQHRHLHEIPFFISSNCETKYLAAFLRLNTAVDQQASYKATARRVVRNATRFKVRSVGDVAPSLTYALRCADTSYFTVLYNLTATGTSEVIKDITQRFEDWCLSSSSGEAGIIVNIKIKNRKKLRRERKGLKHTETLLGVQSRRYHCIGCKSRAQITSTRITISHHTSTGYSGKKSGGYKMEIKVIDNDCGGSVEGFQEQECRRCSTVSMILYGTRTTSKHYDTRGRQQHDDNTSAHYTKRPLSAARNVTGEIRRSARCGTAEAIALFVQQQEEFHCSVVPPSRDGRRLS
ncbi:hypothetical protein J6590_083858 [Homalodisca vitripennis]|nr:hypothetical protein J6590_083858 [Homalodisca vitripennis]